MYQHHFCVYRKDLGGHARHYLAGLLGRSPSKNLQGIEADVADSDYEGMQHFLSASPWDHRALMRQIAEETDQLLGEDSALYVDETSFVKKGNASVGVKRQYCGRLGKLENCQVAVFLAQGRGQKVSPVDYRLFLPADWAEDQARCERAKIPEENRRHQTKTELALEMIAQARERGSRHRWIGGDEVYGNNQGFTNALEDQGETYLMDIAANRQIWTSPPQAKGQENKRGRPRSHPEIEPAPLSAAEVADQHIKTQAREIEIRDTTKGKLRAKIWAARVWEWDGEKARPRWLVVREEKDGSRKYTMGNPPAETSWEQLAQMQAQRFWIERAFQDAKSGLGLAQYEVRGWSGWHHHMALVSLAQLFTLKERKLAEKSRPLLSVRDIVELLEYYLPRRERSEKEVMRRLKQRHRARRRELERHRSKTAKTNLPK